MHFLGFWRYSGWIWVKLAPIYLKRHLQHDSVPFFPLTSRLTTFLLRQPHSQKTKFLPFLFLLFLPFCCSDWPPTGPTTTSKNSVKASLRQAILTMEFALSFSIEILSSLGIFQSPLSQSLWSAYHWWWHQKWNKGQGSSQPVMASMWEGKRTPDTITWLFVCRPQSKHLSARMSAMPSPDKNKPSTITGSRFVGGN